MKPYGQESLQTFSVVVGRMWKTEKSRKEIMNMNNYTQNNQNRGGQQLQHLPRYAKNLVEDARNGKLDPVIGRDEEIRRVLQILSRRTKNNPILIGEPGTGKTAIVEGLAQRIVRGDVPENLKRKMALSWLERSIRASLRKG